VIWDQINPTWRPDKRNKRVLFLEQLGKALITPHIQRRERLPLTAASAALVKAVQWAESSPDLVLIHLRLQLGQARGGDANTPKKDCKSNTTCCTCEKYICKVYAHTLAYCPTCAN
jgi:hypothetical protein